ncbi:hypothetical protein OA92_15345 [Marinomonas sp. SBI22]|uniref:hypothetical protein n=1 Tax=unclassified Marinomonas TaxID=196814 RepID=UPI0007AF4AA5|nr:MULTISPECIES: hypothetical protein [unclassified Marinomonas]KZM40953.1 hypothetical protein OA92_15345 [Marinomonas sp. SBI22]KZM42793.1 hypothetical protein OA91_13550 [Marinomonas sp. SBI8L]
MKIDTVKKVGDSYLVNEKMVVPNVSENAMCRKVKAWLEAGNTLIPEFTDTELMALKLAEVDAECTRRIELYWNQVGQLNAALGVYSDENAAACKHWITANLNARETLLERADIINIDVTENEYWPELP